MTYQTHVLPVLLLSAGEIDLVHVGQPDDHLIRECNEHLVAADALWKDRITRSVGNESAHLKNLNYLLFCFLNPQIT